jgi:DNA repair exonuclease SbcCD ATPase subunit
VKQVKRKYDDEKESLQKKLDELESENKHLRTRQEHHPHSIFDIDYVPAETSTIDQLRSELKKSNEKIETLQISLNQQFTDYEDIKSKYSIQYRLNESRSKDSAMSDNERQQLKELESKFERITEQLNRFDQCHFESEEQIRLLKQIVFNQEQPARSIAPSLTVKRSDLAQQTSIVENLLQKQNESIVSKLTELLDQSSCSTQDTTLPKKKTKRKRS